MHDVQSVMFDLDGTICRYTVSHQEVLADAFETLGVDPFLTIEDYVAEIDEFADEASTQDELRRLCFESLAAKDGRDPTVGIRLADAYASHRDYTDVEFLPGAEDALASLSESYDLAIVTNGEPETQCTKLDALGVRSLFDAIVYAGHDAAYKPDPEPFRAALDAVSVAPGETLFVGDDFESDVRGAHSVGLGTAWLTSDPPDKADPPTFWLSSMQELPSLRCFG